MYIYISVVEQTDLFVISGTSSSSRRRANLAEISIRLQGASYNYS